MASTKHIGDYAFKAGGVKGRGTSAEVSITFSPVLPLKILLYISNTYMLPQRLHYIKALHCSLFLLLIYLFIFNRIDII